MTVFRWHSGGTVVAGATVIRVWEYGGMVAWCSKWVVVSNFAGEESQVLGYMEIW